MTICRMSANFLPLPATGLPVITIWLVVLCFQGDRETFENYYRKQRKKQARLVLQPQSNMVRRVPLSICSPV